MHSVFDQNAPDTVALSLLLEYYQPQSHTSPPSHVLFHLPGIIFPLKSASLFTAWLDLFLNVTTSKRLTCYSVNSRGSFSIMLTYCNLCEVSLWAYLSIVFCHPPQETIHARDHVHLVYCCTRTLVISTVSGTTVLYSVSLETRQKSIQLHTMINGWG